MSNDRRKIRFGLWYDFRNPAQWRQSADRLYREILDQIAWGENNGFDDVWLSEHHFTHTVRYSCNHRFSYETHGRRKLSGSDLRDG